MLFVSCLRCKGNAYIYFMQIFCVKNTYISYYLTFRNKTYKLFYICLQIHIHFNLIIYSGAPVWLHGTPGRGALVPVVVLTA